jgi:hypothetical protein
VRTALCKCGTSVFFGIYAGNASKFMTSQNEIDRVRSGTVRTASGRSRSPAQTRSLFDNTQVGTGAGTIMTCRLTGPRFSLLSALLPSCR